MISLNLNFVTYCLSPTASRSAGKPRKTDTKVVAGGGKQVVSGTGVSSRKRQEAAANNGATGRRNKVVPKQRWR